MSEPVHMVVMTQAGPDPMLWQEAIACESVTEAVIQLANSLGRMMQARIIVKPGETIRIDITRMGRKD